MNVVQNKVKTNQISKNVNYLSFYVHVETHSIMCSMDNDQWEQDFRNSQEIGTSYEISKAKEAANGMMNKQLQMGTATTACKRKFVEQSNSPPIPQRNVSFAKTITHGTKLFYTLNSR